jgi:signal peptidase I
MEFRVLKPGESGTSRAGLVGLLIPEDAGKSTSDSHVLVMVRQPNLGVHAFHLSGGQVERVYSPQEYLKLPVMAQPQPLSVAARRWRIAGYAVLVALLAVLTGFGIAGVTGLVSMRVVLTGSMVPTINPGDLIVTVNDNLLAPREGDVVVYTGRTFEGKAIAPFAHRIIGGNATEGWIVKGDANPLADVQRPTETDIESVVVATVPVVGRFINVQFLILLAALGFGVWLIVDGLRRRT